MDHQINGDSNYNFIKNIDLALILNSLTSLCQETVLHDVTLVCGDGTMKSSRALLALAFPPLMEVLKNREEEVLVLIMPDFTQVEIKDLLRKLLSYNLVDTRVDSKLDEDDEEQLKYFDMLTTDIKQETTLSSTESVRGTETPEYYYEVSIKGDRKFYKYKVGMDRFNMKYTKKSGIACFKCHKRGCTSIIYARYPNYETWNDDEPKITSGPTKHILNGTEHTSEGSERFTQRSRRKIKDALPNSELVYKPVNNINKEVVNDVVRSLNIRNEKEGFLGKISKLEDIKQGQYKVRNRAQSPSSATSPDTDFNWRVNLNPVNGVHIVLSDELSIKQVF